MPYSDDHQAHFEAQSDEPSTHDTYPERRIAAAVIHRAALDLMASEPRSYKGQNKWELEYKTRMWQDSRADAYKFLTGASEMSGFWFKVLERPYQTGTFEALRAILKARVI